MANEHKFNGKAEGYAQYRPSYPKEYIDYLVAYNNLVPDNVVADVGSGTGVLSALLMERELNVVATEPNPQMRSVAEQQLGGNPRFASSDGSAEQIKLPEASVDCITAAQAFHWFDAEAFHRECRRVLRPGGNVCLVWNERDTALPLTAELMEIYQAHCPNFTEVQQAHRLDIAGFLQFFRQGRYEYRMFPNPVTYDLDSFLGRALSTSYAPQRGEDWYDQFVQAVTQLFQRHSHGNDQVVSNDHTCSYIGRP